MTIFGITSTTERGVRVVTTAQNLTSASATSESIVIDGAGTTAAIRATGTADILLKRCNIHVNATAASLSQINQVWLSYNGNDTSRTVTTRKLRLQETSVMVKSAARVDFFFSELANCLISEVDSTRNVNVYTQPGAVLNNVRFTGINTWEVVGTPSQAGALTFESVKSAFFNYEAGRLDFTRMNVVSFTVSSCFFSNGNGGNNSAYNWDVVSFDRTKIGRELANNLYFEGVSASLEFRDRDTSVAQNDVLVIYRDDRTTAGIFTERGRYVTGANGRMAGTFDSRFNVVGANQERPTLFMLRWKMVDNPSTGAHTSLTFIGAAGRRYDMVAVQPRIEVRSYLHQAPSGYGPADNYTFAGPQGIINGDFSVSTYANFNLVTDSSVTASKATALAYTQLDTLEQLYNRDKAEWRDNDGRQLATSSGTSLTFGNRNIVVDDAATTAYAFNAGTNTVTIKSAALAASAKFKSLSTTGTVTIASGTSITDTSIIGNVIQSTPADLTNVTITGNLTYSTGTSLSITLTNSTVSGTVSNTGAGIISIVAPAGAVGVYGAGTVYVLPTYTLTIADIQPGSDVVVLAAGTSTVLGTVDQAPGTSWGFEYQSIQAVDIGVIKRGFIPRYVRNYSLTTGNASLPVAQVPDPSYLE